METTHKVHVNQYEEKFITAFRYAKVYSLSLCVCVCVCVSLTPSSPSTMRYSAVGACRTAP